MGKVCEKVFESSFLSALRYVSDWLVIPKMLKDLKRTIRDNTDLDNADLDKVST